jgi:HEPN domain-containing protein
LAADHLKRAGARLRALDVLFESGSWADVVRESQEVVELSLTGLLRACGVDPPRIHDVADVLLAERERLPEGLSTHVERLASSIVRITGLSRVDRRPAYRPRDPDHGVLRRETRGDLDQVVVLWSRRPVAADPLDLFPSGLRAPLDAVAAAMRGAAEQRFRGEPRFLSIRGTAEATTLRARSVDVVVAPEVLQSFFGGNVRAWSFPNEQRFDFDGVRGRLLSSSYAPGPEHPRHDTMMAELRRIFDEHHENGQVRFVYDTRLFLGQLREQPD